MEAQKGNKVTIHYVGTLDNGSEFDNSRTKGTPMVFELGAGTVIPGFENAIFGMTVGDRKKFSISAQEAYGERIEEAVQNIPRKDFPEDMQLAVGGFVTGNDEAGNPVHAKVLAINEQNVVLDFNHTLAGQSLNFDVEVLSVE